MENKEVKNKSPQTKADIKHRVLNIVGIVLCVILLPILVTNCILIVKGMSNDKEVPSLGKYVPLIVLTESMEPQIKAGDMIIVKKVNVQNLKEGNVIAFYDPAGNGSSVVTHKIKDVIYNADGTVKEFITFGTNNFNSDGSIEIDKKPVPVANVIGRYKTRIAVLGSIAMFMQSTLGLIVCIVIPLAALIVYDVMRRRKQDLGKEQDIEKLKAELEMLKLQKELAQLKGEAVDDQAQETQAQSVEQGESSQSQQLETSQEVVQTEQEESK